MIRISTRMSQMSDEKKSKNAWWQAGLQLFLRLSSWIVGPILLAVLLGKFLDKTFNTEPWIFLITIILSFTFSMYKIVKIGMREIEKENPKSK